jgi:demethylmenaquinone methyltransferase / 2-methoxy-6-polyprenyl-1,4-benzoquinol methylase
MSRASLDKQPPDVAAMFDEVAPRYDRTNAILSMRQDRRWRDHVVRAHVERAGELVLDLAAGTGTSSDPLADAGVKVVACDFSLGMLSAGRSRRDDLAFVAGDALHLPFADGVFDAVTISFGLRNVVDTEAALGEMRRVTRHGGRLVVCEFSHPTMPVLRTVYSGYLVRALPKVAGRVASNPQAYSYLAESITEWPDQRELASVVRRAGWDDVAYRNLTGGIVALHRAVRP